MDQHGCYIITILIFSLLLFAQNLLDSLFEDYYIDKEEESRLIDGLNDEDFDKGIRCIHTFFYFISCTYVIISSF